MKTNILYDTKYYFQQNKKKIQKDSLGGGVLHAQLLNQQVWTEAFKKSENKAQLSTQVYNEGNKSGGDGCRVMKTTVITNTQDSDEKKAVQE